MRIAGIVCLGLALVIVLLTFSISYEATKPTPGQQTTSGKPAKFWR